MGGVSFTMDLLLGQIVRLDSADDVLAPYVYVFYVSFAVSLLFTPLMRSVAVHYNVVDQPDKLRKLHSTPVAYLGGVAVFLGWLGGLAISQVLYLHRNDPGLLPHVHIKFSIVAGACAIVILGLWDDVRGLRPRIKIGGQIFAAIMLLVEGVGRYATRPILQPIAERLNELVQFAGPGGVIVPEWLIVVTSSILVISLVVFCCNAANLMDGLDGLCGGVTAIIAAGFLFLAVHLAINGVALNSNWDALRIVLALALLGAVLGFIPYNFNPASIFMGDTGSMFLGFACAVSIILLAREQSKWFLAALVVFALPILDTALALTRRWMKRRPLFSADRFHFHHQLVSRGFSVRQTVIVSYGLAVAFAALGGAIVLMRTRYALAVYLVIFGGVIVATYKLGMVHERPGPGRRESDGTPEPVEPELENSHADSNVR